MHPRHLEKFAAFRRSDLVLHHVTVAIEPDGNFNSGTAERPDLAKHAGETANILARDGLNHIASPQSGPLRRPAVRKPDNHHSIVDLGRIEPEPGARRPVGPAMAQQVIQDWLEE